MRISASLLGSVALLTVLACGVDNPSVSSTAPVTVPHSAPTLVPHPLASEAAAQATFKQVNEQILRPHCLSCHSGRQNPDLSAYDTFAGDPTYVVPGNPARSLLYALVQTGAMPQGGPRLTPVQLTLLQSWIARGAPND